MKTQTNISAIRLHRPTVERLRKFKPYPEMSDDKLLNILIDKLEAAEPKPEASS
ncbi:MAG: hypothetical protein AB1529_03030 [Candidatus Micrarchaeota archaeon]